MLIYNNHELEGIKEIESFLKSVGIKPVTCDDVWAEARKNKEIPCFENILWEITYKKLENYLNENYPDLDCSFEANEISLYFIIDSQEHTLKESIDKRLRAYRLDKKVQEIGNITVSVDGEHYKLLEINVDGTFDFVAHCESPSGNSETFDLEILLPQLVHYGIHFYDEYSD